MNETPKKKRRCRACMKKLGISQEFDSLADLRRHYAEAGHPTKTKAKPEPEPEPQEEADPESSLMAEVVSAFLSFEVSESGRQRVIDYVQERFGIPRLSSGLLQPSVARTGLTVQIPPNVVQAGVEMTHG